MAKETIRKATTPTLEELARLVCEWAKCDDEIAMHGWDGGPNEQAWENARIAMVGAALSVIDESEGKRCQTTQRT